jgi:hypothetical protein
MIYLIIKRKHYGRYIRRASDGLESIGQQRGTSEPTISSEKVGNKVAIDKLEHQFQGQIVTCSKKIKEGHGFVPLETLHLQSRQIIN